MHTASLFPAPTQENASPQKTDIDESNCTVINLSLSCVTQFRAHDTTTDANRHSPQSAASPRQSLTVISFLFRQKYLQQTQCVSAHQRSRRRLFPCRMYFNINRCTHLISSLLRTFSAIFSQKKQNKTTSRPMNSGVTMNK